MKRFFELFGLFFLVIFTFLYSSQIQTVIKDNDDIVKTLNESKHYYEKDSIDALISDDYIVPGISGYEVDVDDSYNRMKKIGYFNDNLITYENILPVVSIKERYDKYIISGNESLNNVYLNFSLFNFSEVDEILYILDNYNIRTNFNINQYFYLKHYDHVIKIISAGHSVSIDINGSDDINLISNLFKTDLGISDVFCFYDEENLEKFKNCQTNRNYSVLSNNNINTDFLTTVKNDLKKGIIFNFKVNAYLINQLPSIINYINYRDFSFKTFNNLIVE